MRRLLWLGIGIAVGAIVVRQVSRAVRAYSPAGLAGSAKNSAAGLVDSVRDFVADVREGMAVREAEIHAAFERGESLADIDDDYDYDEDDGGRITGERPGGYADRDGIGIRR